jgi:hypothetical protein
MTWQNYQLGTTISKATEAMKLWQTERGVIEISGDTLLAPIKFNDQEKGYIFHGHGKLLLDAIVETEEGAIGRPVERELDEHFLMLGKTEKIQEHFSVASKEDLTRMGYENQQAFVEGAEDLLDRFFNKGIRDSCHHFNRENGLVFAFENPTGKLDILVADDSKIVYTAEDVVFVSNESNVVLKSPSKVVCSNNGKSVIIKKGKSVIVKK